MDVIRCQFSDFPMEDVKGMWKKKLVSRKISWHYMKEKGKIMNEFMDKKSQYYFFGAGCNCRKAIEFWGADSIIALVDNSSAKIGTTVMGLLVIGFDEFRRKWKGETVVITAIIKADEIVQQLQDGGIDNYYVCPYMQSGYSCSEIIERLNLARYTNFAVCDKNPLSEKIMLELQKIKNCEIRYVSEDTIEDNIGEDEALFIVKQNFKSVSLYSKEKFQNVIDLFDEIGQMQIKDFEYLKKYKGIHNGEICFLIGNGPSLTAKDLDIISDNRIKSVGCNRIYKIFGKTKWRPTYYIVSDNMVWDDEKDNLPNESKYLIRKSYNNQLSGINLDAQLYYTEFENYYPGYPTFSDDMTKGIYGGRTVMFSMLQIAVYMGFKEIYLLGVDFSWGEDGRDTHFCKDYMNDELVKDTMCNKDEVHHAYIAAKNYADSHGIKIYNATRGGYLEVFERVNFDEIF